MYNNNTSERTSLGEKLQLWMEYVLFGMVVVVAPVGILLLLFTDGPITDLNFVWHW